MRYMLKIVNITSNELIRNESVTEKYLVINSPARRIVCDQFKITVTPINPVGAGPSQSFQIQYDGKYSI